MRANNRSHQGDIKYVRVRLSPQPDDTPTLLDSHTVSQATT